jgi:hypothetical protein
MPRVLAGPLPTAAHDVEERVGRFMRLRHRPRVVSTATSLLAAVLVATGSFTMTAAGVAADTTPPSSCRQSWDSQRCLLLQNQLFRETPAPLTHLDPYRLDQVTLAGGHNTYQKKGAGNNEVLNDITDTYNELVDTLKTTQTVEIDVWTDGGNFYVNHNPGFLYFDRNDNNCSLGGNFQLPRNQDLYSCLEGLKHWHDRHPNHPLVIIKLEMKNGFAHASPQQLEDVFRYRDVGLAPLLFKPSDLTCVNYPSCTGRYASPDAAARAGNWPTLDKLRGKFMVTMVSGAFALSSSAPCWAKDLIAGCDDGPVTYARALNDGSVSGYIFPALLMKQANRDPRASDPRRTDYPHQSDFLSKGVDLSRWVVVFDMESGYLPAPYGSGDISADTLGWIRINHFFDFVSVHDPAQPCNGDARCINTLTNIMCPAGVQDFYVYSCVQQWKSPPDPKYQVNIPLGRAFTSQISNDYQFNVIDDDQERLGLVDPKPITGSLATSRWDALDQPGPSGNVQQRVYTPTVVNWGGGFTDVFGTVGTTLWTREFGPHGWSSWRSLATPTGFRYAPSVLPTPTGDFIMAAPGTDGSLWYGSWLRGNAQPSWWREPNPAHFETVALAYSGQTIEVFATTQQPGASCASVTAPPQCGVWHREFSTSGSGTWDYLGGPVHNQVSLGPSGEPINATPIGGSTVFLFAKAPDGSMYQTVWMPNTPPYAWFPIVVPTSGDNAIRSAPTVVVHTTPNPGLDLYYLGGNLQLWRSHYDATTLAWSTPVGVAGPVASPSSPGHATAFIDGETDLYYTGSDGVLYHKRFDTRAR